MLLQPYGGGEDRREGRPEQSEQSGDSFVGSVLVLTPFHTKTCSPSREDSFGGFERVFLAIDGCRR